MKSYFAFLGLILIGILIAWGAYGLIGSPLIESAYKGESLEIFNQIIEGQDLHSLDFYLDSSKKILTRLSILAFILGLFLCVFHWIVYKIFKLKTSDLIIISVVTLLLFEGVLRLVLFVDIFKIDKLRDPGLYTDNASDENYFSLNRVWGYEHQPANPEENKIVYDPLHGWVPEKNDKNPLGIIARTPYAPNFEENTILFYGDSYIQGETPMESKIPQLLDKEIGDYEVYNYGVQGYSVGQILLRFQKTYALFKNPLIVIGVLTRDMDRTILKHRSKPKPYFILENGELSLKGTPVPEVNEEWLRKNKPTIKSYLLAYIIQKIRKRDGRIIYLKREEKEALTAKMIEAMVREAEENNLGLLFVLFGWEPEKKAFLKEQFEKWNIPYVDARAAMHRDAGGRAFYEKSDYFYKVGGHLNVRAHKAITRAIRVKIQEEFGI